MDSIKKRKIDENGVDGSDTVSNLTLEDTRKILEPITHEQLLEILHAALIRHDDVLDAVRSIADRDMTQRKLFIRGLGWDTTTEGLRALFSTYGDLEEAIVILDKATGKSKGYGFVTFKHVDGALLALKEPSKKIDGRMTVTQLAAAGASGPASNTAQPRGDVLMRKIYVSNVPFDMQPERLLAHFSSYGEVEEGPLGFDKQTQKSKGFALFVYKTPEGAQNALVDPTKTIDGRQMICKYADEGKKNKPGVVAGPGGVQAPTGVPGEGARDGLGLPPSSMQGSIASQYGGHGGPGGISSYGVYSGGVPQFGHHMNSSLPSSLGVSGLSSVGGGPGLSSVGSHASSLGAGGGYGVGLGGPYGASPYGGPPSSGYGGLGGAGSGLGGPAGGSSYGRVPPTSVGMPSGGAPEGAQYSLSSSAYPSQHHQTAGTSPVPRVPHGGMYQSFQPNYF